MSRSDFLPYHPNMHPPMLPPSNYRYYQSWQQQQSRPGDQSSMVTSSNMSRRERSGSMLSDASTVQSPNNFQQSPAGSGPHRARASASLRPGHRDRDETRRRNHIMSEQKRRCDINDHLSTLRKIIPEGEEGDSKAVTLAKTIRHVQQLHHLLVLQGIDLAELPTTAEQMPKLTNITAPSPKIVQDIDSEPLTPSSVSSVADHSFFSEPSISFQRSSSETEESDGEPQPKRRLSVRDLCI